MEPEGPLLCFQEPATGPYRQPYTCISITGHQQLVRRLVF
jgi:hypothetical protein